MRKARAYLSILLAVTLAVMAGTALFRVSQQVQTAEEKQESLVQAVASEKEAIRVLNAEWDYLNRPDRLEALSQEYLHMRQPQMKQMESSPAQLPELHAPPTLEAQPAALEIPVTPPVQRQAQESAPTPRPPAKPQRAAPQRDFHRMLNDLAPAAGGKR